MTITLPDNQKTSEAIRQALGDSIVDLIPARLGNPLTGQVIVSNTDRQGLVWVHGIGDDVASAYTAVNALPFANQYIIYGLPILVRYRNDRYVVEQLDAEIFGEFLSSYVGAHDQNPVYVDQILYGTIHPNPSSPNMQALTIGAFYGDDRVGDILTADFSSSPLDTSSNPIDVPTNNNRAIGVLVQLDASTGTLEYKQGAEFNASLTHKQAYDNGFYPTPDANRYRLGWIRLVKGQTAITYNEIMNAPTWFGGSGGGGTVTSVGLALPSEFDVTGSPVTSSGDLTGAWADQLQNLVFASPDASTGTPTFRALVADDIPSLPYAPTSHTHVVGDVDSEASTNGQVMTSDGAGNASWVTPTNGTVTSVDMSVPSDLSVSGNPITSSGTLAVTRDSQNQNLVLASPDGSSGTPTYRQIVDGDIDSTGATNGQVLTANGSGATTWQTPSGGSGGYPKFYIASGTTSVAQYEEYRISAPFSVNTGATFTSEIDSRVIITL
mgnify:CR=1 FL=1|jgi:hypothetical protein